MQTESHERCFHSKQLGHHTLESNSREVGPHIESCRPCQVKIKTILDEKRTLKKHFESFNTPNDVKTELQIELTEVLNSMTPSVSDKVKSHSKKFNKEVRVNSFHFLMHFIQPRNLKILTFTCIFILVSRFLINT